MNGYWGRGLLAVNFICILLFTGCGYRMAGRASRLPQNIQSIAVPAFVNQTQQYKFEQTLTQAVVHELVNRTQFRIINKADPNADATLRGYLTSVQASPMTFDSATGRASTVLVTIDMKVALVDRHGKTIFENQNYKFRDEYQVSRELSSFFQEEGPALHRLSREFARTLVSDILEAY